MNKNIISEIIEDWTDAKFDDEDGWEDGMPVKYLVNPDDKLKQLLGGLEFSLLSSYNKHGYYNVKVTGPTELINDIVEKCSWPAGVIKYVNELMKSETKESYEKWV